MKVRFDVSKTGQTRKLRIVEASPPGLYENEVLRALGTWRFCPNEQGDVARTGLVINLSWGFESAR